MLGKEKALKGIIPPIVTPLKGRDSLDEAGLERLVERLVEGGVHGVFVLGTTGEAQSLSYKLRREMLERTCRVVAGRIPVIAGITDTAFMESVALGEFAASCGADGLVLAPPYYFPSGQAELLEYLEHLLSCLPLPLILYNMPAMTKISYNPETVLAASAMPGVVGIKDSSGDMGYFHKLRHLLEGRTDFPVLVGPEELLMESLLMGAQGGICGGANLFPNLFVELYEAASARDFKRASELHAKVLRLGSGIYGIGQYKSSYLKGLKCALSCLGICSDFLAEPFHKFHERERERVKAALEAMEGFA